MEVEKLKLIQQLEEMGEVVFVKRFEDPRDAFAHYFSILDIEGIDRLLSDKNYYDGATKLEYLKLIDEHFISLKKNGIYSLSIIPGKCNGCKNGCLGFTFLDEKEGFYSDFIIETKNTEIVNFMECFNLINDVEISNKKEQITIKPFKLDSDRYNTPF
ncbi:hypothetical protein WFZ85_04320 [Flavobacterium sp. j3]|uniref:Uncharacterized protein n=1 Tax=Flavobacterium aureirubrum TaxID=3133147 RepID=A0ABU9N286_9FLAO